jgi:hypothetical protein
MTVRSSGMTWPSTSILFSRNGAYFINKEEIYRPGPGKRKTGNLHSCG